MPYNKQQKRAYYKANRERILNAQKARYKPKTKRECKVCGASLKDLPNGNFRYCNKCIADPTKVSRQAAYYRRNRFRIKLLQKLNKQNKEGLR